jgi:hypothetical protein
MVVVVTDGKSKDKVATLREAKNLKERGFSVVSIGVGNVTMDELNGIASGPNSVFKIENYELDTLYVLAGFSLTAYQQPAMITEKTEIKSDVRKNSYKYFKYSTKNKTEKISLEVKDLNGKTEVYYSFEDENPKSPNDFILSNTTETKSSADDISRFSPKTFDDKISVVITRPSNSSVEFLFIGIRGVSEANEFQIQVSNIESPKKSFNPTTVIIISVLAVIIGLTIIGVIYKKRSKLS